MDRSYSQDEVIKAIKNGGKDKEECFTYLVENRFFGLFVRYSKQFSDKLQYNEIRSAYHDALLKFVDYLIKGKIDNIDAYFHRTFQRFLFQLLRDKKKIASISLEIDENLAANIEYTEPDQADQVLSKKLETAIEQLGIKCQEIIHARFILGISGNALASRLNLKNANTASASLSRCMKQLDELLQKMKER